MEAITLPDGMVTTDAAIAAEQWAKAFYQVKDALQRIRPVPEQIIRQVPIKDLDETLSECDNVLQLGDR
ncbi:MAG: hypothetical protein KAS32_23885 [Candidatus Peribacteraceae bacterium]|nr:hypothetical protein [Candidatus Peribacteraceae bacterium]